MSFEQPRLEELWHLFFEESVPGSVIGSGMTRGAGDSIRLINPADGEGLVSYADAGADVASSAVAMARRAQRQWEALPTAERGRVMYRVGSLVREARKELAELEAISVGKPIRDALVEVGRVAEMFEYYAGWCDKLHGEVIPVPGSYLNYTLREPVGVVVQITPWNAPLFTAGWQLAPALACGNAAVLKPSELTPISSLCLAKILGEAGVPPGVVNVLAGLGSTTGQAAVSDPSTSLVVFVGSVPTGRRVAAACGAHLKPHVLELGGKSANIVFQDADFELAIRGAQAAIFASSGQSCVAGSRLLIQASLYDRFVDELARRAAELPMGLPTDPSVHVGPIQNQPQFEKIESMIAASVADGAVALARDSEGTPDKGFFVAPTVVAQATNQMPISQQEVFGPVVSAIPFRDEDDAIALANDSPFALAGAVWTRDVGTAHRLARAVKAGTFWVNSYKALHVSSPFGGFGQSGHGRSSGIEALRTYTQPRSIWVETSAQPTMSFGLGRGASQAGE